MQNSPILINVPQVLNPCVEIVFWSCHCFYQMINWKLFWIRISFLDNNSHDRNLPHTYDLFLHSIVVNNITKSFKCMKSRFSVSSISKKIVPEKGSFQILNLESISESCTFFTQIKLLFHHQRYYTNNSTYTKSFFIITSFYCLAGSSFTQSTKVTL